MRSTGLGWPAEDVRTDGGTTLRSGLGWPSDDDAEHAPRVPRETSPAASVKQHAVRCRMFHVKRLTPAGRMFHVKRPADCSRHR